MNIQHLELFYYVATYGGIREAVRNIPYGIQGFGAEHNSCLLDRTCALLLVVLAIEHRKI